VSGSSPDHDPADRLARKGRPDLSGVAPRRPPPASAAADPLGTKVFAEAAYTTTHWFDLRLAELAPEERATLAAAVEVINKVAAG